MSTPVLSLRNFGVSFGDRTVIERVNMEVRPREIVVLIGPGGAGKSTLLRTICGDNDGHRSMEIRGEVKYLGDQLDGGERPVLIEQTPDKMMDSLFEFLASHTPDRSTLTRREFRTRLCRRLEEMWAADLVERLDEPLIELGPADRRLAMLSAGVFEETALLCVDEPTAGLDDDDAERLLDFLRLQAERRSVLMVTHHQRRARAAADRVALLAGGKICERAPSHNFFDDPETPEARSFVGTGSCTVASPDARPEELAPDYRRRDTDDDAEQVVLLESANTDRDVAAAAPSARRGPIGFHWMRPGRLAGTPMPGAMRSIEDDLAALERVGVSVLVTLTMQSLAQKELQAFDIGHLHVPIVDMGVPTMEDAAECCRKVSERLDDDEVVAFHCRAGIGRTGTMLAIYEIWEGMSADDAFEAARSVHRRWIQSQRQRIFLSEFEQWLEESR